MNRIVLADTAGLPLSAYFNPRQTTPNGEQSRSFPRGLLFVFYPLLQRRFRPLGRPPTPRKAGYTAHSVNRMQVHIPCRSPCCASRYHKHGSPREKGICPHAIADCPLPLTPRIDPRLGVGSQHQELHRFAIGGFLAPPSKSTKPTRILRRQPKYLLFRPISVSNI